MSERRLLLKEHTLPYASSWRDHQRRATGYMPADVDVDHLYMAGCGREMDCGHCHKPVYVYTGKPQPWHRLFCPPCDLLFCGVDCIIAHAGAAHATPE